MHWRFVWITLIHAKLTIQTRIKPREQTIHVCTKTRFHIQLDYYLWYFLRGYDLVVYIQCLWPFKVAGFRNSMHRSCISLFSHKFSATSKIVPFSVGVCIFVFICFIMGIRRERPRCPRHSKLHSQFSGKTKWWIYLYDNNVSNKIIGLYALSELTLNEAIKHQ